MGGGRLLAKKGNIFKTKKFRMKRKSEKGAGVPRLFLGAGGGVSEKKPKRARGKESIFAWRDIQTRGGMKKEGREKKKSNQRI